VIRLLRFRPIMSFVFEGHVRDLKDPDGPPTPRQLARLNHLGALAVIEPGQLRPITKGDAAGALDVLEEPMP
jgi:hypothetical protein